MTPLQGAEGAYPSLSASAREPRSVEFHNVDRPTMRELVKRAHPGLEFALGAFFVTQKAPVGLKRLSRLDLLVAQGAPGGEEGGKRAGGRRERTESA